jgi:hypothetical protein
VYSFDVKYDHENPPDKAYGSSGLRISEFSVTVVGSTMPASALVLAWDNSGNATIVPHLDTTDFTDSGSIKKIGGGWYRAFIKGKTDTITDPEAIEISMCPTFFDAGLVGVAVPGDNESTSRGGVFIARPQLELGSVPTQYVENNTSSNVLDDFLKYSSLNRTGSVFSLAPHGDLPRVFVVSAETGLSMSGLYDSPEGDKGVSAYNPIKSELPKYAHPRDRVLTENISTPVERALGFNLHKGHNLVGTSFQDYKLSAVDPGWQPVSGSDNVDFELGRHALLLGGWHSQNGALVYYAGERTESSFEDAVTNHSYLQNTFGFTGKPLSTGDVFGHLLASENAALNLNPPASPTFGLWVSASSDFSSTGYVTYTVSAKDESGALGRGLSIANAFGGINILGLHGIDLKNTRKESPFKFPPYDINDDLNTGSTADYVDPTRRYKLMAKKVYHDNLLRKDGVVGNIGLSPYSDILIQWRLEFI